MAGPVGIGAIRGGSSATRASRRAALGAAWSGHCVEHQFSSFESPSTISPPTRISEPLCEEAGKAGFVVRLLEPMCLMDAHIAEINKRTRTAVAASGTTVTDVRRRHPSAVAETRGSCIDIARLRPPMGRLRRGTRSLGDSDGQ